MHTTEVKVRFYELDPYDHVNHTSYLAYFEAARVEYLEEVGYGLGAMKQQGWQIVVVELSARFHAAAGLNDVLTIETQVGEVGRVRSTWYQEMTRRGHKVASLEISAAFTDRQGRPRRVPEGFVAAVFGRGDEAAV